MPLISVVMPVYNNEKYFPNAVEGILNQDFGDFELIIVDDGSTDNTGKIADEFARRDQRVKVIHQENQWIFASYNRGVKESKGEYIFFHNSDDKLRPDIFGVLYKKILEYRPDIIWTKVLSHICDEDQKIIKYDIKKMDERVQGEGYYATLSEVRQAWSYFMKSNLAQNQINLYKRKLVIEHSFRNDIFGADTLFNIAIAPYVKSAVVLDTPIYDHYIYNQEYMNVSVGKHYSYEYKMYGEIYNGYMDLFETWKLNKDDYEDFFSNRMMKQFAAELRYLAVHEKELSLSEKLKIIFCEYTDETMQRCTKVLNNREEYESRILSCARMLLSGEMLPENDEMYFVYELLDSLLRYEKNDEDYMRIQRAIDHPLNPEKIGKIFYEKLKR